MSADIKGIFQLAKPEVFTPILNDGREEARKGPMFFIGDGCAYFDCSYSRCGPYSDTRWLKAWVTIALELDGSEEDGYGLCLEWHCTPPHPDHFLQYIEDGAGSLAILEWMNENYSCLIGEDDTERILLEKGIAPGQRFIAEIMFNSSRDYWGEYDETLHGRVMDIEPWTPEQVLSAWEDYYRVIHRTPLSIGGKDVIST